MASNTVRVHHFDGCCALPKRRRCKPLRLHQTTLAIYGHCGGVALRSRSPGSWSIWRYVEQLYLGATYPMTPEELDHDPFADKEDVEIAEDFGKLGGFMLEEADAAMIGRSIRSDGTAARLYFRRVLRVESECLATPATCVFGADDPLTPDYEEHYSRWLAYVRDIRLSVVPGGHYFQKEFARNLLR